MINNWKEFFKPFVLMRQLLLSTWEKLNDIKPDDIIIEIDPGISFGTGAHETTKLAILGMKKYIKAGDIVLDAGSGSGILSILAYKLGAERVLGIDIDAIATQTAVENAGINNIDALEWKPEEENNIPDKAVLFATGNIIENKGIRNQIGTKTYDVVVANILADVIIPLSDVIGDNIKENGIFISSGILNTKEEEVRASRERNQVTSLEVNRMGSWISFMAKK